MPPKVLRGYRREVVFQISAGQGAESTRLRLARALGEKSIEEMGRIQLKGPVWLGQLSLQTWSLA